MLRQILLAAELFAILVASSFAQESANPLAIPSSATRIERSNTGTWFSEGCEFAKFDVQAAYPGKKTLDSISQHLSTEGFSRVPHVERRFLPSLLSQSFNRWEGFA